MTVGQSCVTKSYGLCYHTNALRCTLASMKAQTTRIQTLINSTALKGRISANDLLRWAEEDKKQDSSNQPPLQFSVLLSMAASLDMTPEELNPIMNALTGQAPDSKKLPAAQKDQQYFEINPMIIGQKSVEADISARQGNLDKATELWLENLQLALDSRMTTAEPYRMYGNLASSAFAAGEKLLAEAALSIALKLNPNYTFAQNLDEQNNNGDFYAQAVRKATESPLVDFVTARDLESETTENILLRLNDYGIKIDKLSFEEKARNIHDSLDTLMDKFVEREDLDSEADNYLYAATDVLWNRLIARPLADTVFLVHV